MKMKHRLGLVLAAVLATFGLAMSTAVPANAGYNYLARSCQPSNEGNDAGRTWLKVTSWWNSSTSKTYHIAVAEDGGFHGSAYNRISARQHGTVTSSTWYKSSPYDNNPQEYYRTVSGTYLRDLNANWSDILGGLPLSSMNCSVTL